MRLTNNSALLANDPFLRIIDHSLKAAWLLFSKALGIAYEFVATDYPIVTAALSMAR